MANYPKRLAAAALLLPAFPALATTVPGSGADELVRILLYCLIGGIVAGLWACFLVENSEWPVFSFLWPLLAVSGLVVAMNPDLTAGDYASTVLLCGVPYIIVFVIGANISSRRAQAARIALGDRYISRPTLVPSDEGLVQLRELLAKEVEAERRGDGRTEDLALLCSVQLFGRGMLEDVLRIWDAKTASKALDRRLDFRLLCGAGLQATKDFLAAHPSKEAADALRLLTEREESGHFVEFTTQGHLDSYRRYFGLEPT